jgi:hypothetical protein
VHGADHVVIAVQRQALGKEQINKSRLAAIKVMRYEPWIQEAGIGDYTFHDGEVKRIYVDISAGNLDSEKIDDDKRKENAPKDGF